MKRVPTYATTIQEPPVSRFLFGDLRVAPLWLVVRLFLGYSWLAAGWGKLQEPAWIQTGEALKAFWLRAIALPEAPAKPPITYDWYRSFIQTLLDSGHYVWFAKLVAYGEIAVGVALVLGAFVGIAAFSGAFMNFNYLLAGTASTNPVLFLFAILLIFAWRTAGSVGLDRWLLPRLGTPWQPPREIRRQLEGAV